MPKCLELSYIALTSEIECHFSCADITVKIITLPEDKQKEGGGEESVRTHADGGNDLSAAISKLLDSLLVSPNTFAT